MTRPMYADRSDDISEYSKAMAKCKGLLKNPTPNRCSHFARKGRDGKPEPDYADLDKVIDTIREAAAKCDLDWTHEFQPLGDRWVICLEIVHGESGQWRRSYLPFPTECQPMQQAGAATFFRRIMLCSAFGLAADRDDDGVTANDAAANHDAAKTLKLQKMVAEALSKAATDEAKQKVLARAQAKVDAGELDQTFVDSLA